MPLKVKACANYPTSDAWRKYMRHIREQKLKTAPIVIGAAIQKPHKKRMKPIAQRDRANESKS